MSSPTIVRRERERERERERAKWSNLEIWLRREGFGQGQRGKKMRRKVEKGERERKIVRGRVDMFL
jgi:hypothetical protein